MFVLSDAGKKMINKKINLDYEPDIAYGYQMLAQRNMNKKQTFEVYIFEIHAKNGKSKTLKLKPQHYNFIEMGL